MPRRSATWASYTHKVKAWDEGKWVRDAATAYAAKQVTKLDESFGGQDS